MAVVLWENDVFDTGRHFSIAVKQAVGSSRLEMYSDFDSFQRRVRRPGLADAVAVLVTHTRQDLHTAATLRGFLSELKVILVLPDRDRETVALGHSMNPRYLTCVDSDPADLAAVLTRMVGFTSETGAMDESRHIRGSRIS